MSRDLGRLDSDLKGEGLRCSHSDPAESMVVTGCAAALGRDHDSLGISRLTTSCDAWSAVILASAILDTGCRIDELLTARVIDFDLDNLLLTVVGKGRKQRKVPFSIELRKLLFRFGQAKDYAEVRSELMFRSRRGQVGALERSQELLLPTGEPGATADRVSLVAAHLRHSIPAARGRCGVALVMKIASAVGVLIGAALVPYASREAIKGVLGAVLLLSAIRLTPSQEHHGRGL